MAMNLKFLYITHDDYLQGVWGVYKVCCDQVDSRVLVYTTFCSYWRKLLPQIIITKPRTDLCWQCQQNNTLILKATNKSAEEKSKVKYYTHYVQTFYLTYVL